MGNSYHACATCVNFLAFRAKGKMKYFCRRLGYETKTTHQFNCWEPKDRIKKLIESRQRRLD